jgi:glycosyltransferase involved in cell wall biosynthesis
VSAVATTPRPASGVFLSWVPFHGRSLDLARHLGLRCEFVAGGRGPAPLRYLRAFAATRALLRRTRPPVVVAMSPPAPAVLSVALCTRRWGATVVGDLHTGALRNPRWRWALRPTLWVLRRRGAAIVTTGVLRAECERAGVRTAVANDLVQPLAAPADAAARAAQLRARLGVDRFVLAPLGYGNDEPIGELMAAARLLPDVVLVLTGEPPAALRGRAPENVRFSGYLDRDDLDAAFDAAEAVVALTVREETMQRAAYEALGFRRPLVVSGTRALRAFYEDAAVYVAPTHESIAGGIETARQDPAGWTERMTALLERKVVTQASELEAVRSLCQAAPGDGRPSA